ncbi:MAG TPA: alpha-amylase family glycosyl hydrolase [Anaeromyxobacteraceae bacterium]|nr:alpha-amylase family glycosyl hydrolase [Anaeromyxobacteraceae bacterium]
MEPALPAWLASVHHDGSARHVSNPWPRLGEAVRIRLRIGAAAPVRRAWIRSSPDGEQAFTPMAPAGVEAPARWWEADLVVSEPSVHYRFVLEAEDGVWFHSAAGATAHDPLDAADYRLLADLAPPAWVRGSVFYQVFPDRFARAEPAAGVEPPPRPGPGTLAWEAPPPPDLAFPRVFYGGDLVGLQQRLDHLSALGVDALYLNPILTAPSNHRYDVTDFEHVDASLGGDQALARLRQALASRGMRYLLDLVPNHVGDRHPWFLAAQADPGAPEAEFFTFERHPDRYATWLGVRTLPKLDYRSAELRRRVITGEDSVVRRWLRPPWSADGWRVDVANMLGRQGAVQVGAEVARAIRAAAKSVRPDAYLLGEHFFDATSQLQGDQWDGVMNYGGFAFPLWHWLRGYRQELRRGEALVSPAPFSTAALEAAWRARRAAVPWALQLQQYNLVDSHDVPRIRTTVGGNGALHRLAAVVQLTYPGVPGLYYGDEIGMSDGPQLGPRGCMIWDRDRWDSALLDFYRRLVGLRRASPALREGGFQVLVVEPDTLAYQREGAEGWVLTVAHRGERPRPAGPLPVADGGIPDGVEFAELLGGSTAVTRDGALPLPELSQGATAWLAERPRGRR